MSKKKKTKRQPPQKMDYEAIRAREAERKQKRREKNAGRRKKRLKIACICAAAAVVLGGAAFGTYYYLRSGGWFLRHRTVLESEHYQVTGAMLAVYYQQCVDSYLEYAAQDETAVQLDRSKPFRDQEYYEGYSFYDMFMDTTVNNVEAQLQVCEAAHAAGYDLTQDKKDESRRVAGEKDLSKYQKGVTREDVERATELVYLAQNYQRDTIDSITVSDEEIETYYAQHTNDFLTTGLYGFTFAYDTGDSETDTGVTRDEALQYAQELSECRNDTEFYDYAENYLNNVIKQDAETAQMQLSNLRSSNLLTYFSTEVQEWALSDDTKRYSTLILDRAEQNIVQVVMMLDKPARNEEKTADIRVVVLTTAEFDGADGAKEFAEELIGECEAAGGTPEAFAELAYEYSSDVLTYPNGGVVTGFTPSRTTYGEALAKWAFDKARQPGDMTVVDGPGNVILAYYEAAGEDNGWQSMVRDAFTEEVKKKLDEQNHQAEVTKYPENYKYVTG